MAKRTKVTKREIDLATGVVLGHIIYDAMSDLTSMIIADELRWITIHPNGKGAKLSNGEENVKGKPVLIDTETGKIVGGAIPQSLHGVKLQSKEEREKNGSKSFKDIIKEGEHKTAKEQQPNVSENNLPNTKTGSYNERHNAYLSRVNSESIPPSFDSAESLQKFASKVMPDTDFSNLDLVPLSLQRDILHGATAIVKEFPLLGGRLPIVTTQKGMLKKATGSRNTPFKQAEQMGEAAFAELMKNPQEVEKIKQSAKLRAQAVISTYQKKGSPFTLKHVIGQITLPEQFQELASQPVAIAMQNQQLKDWLLNHEHYFDAEKERHQEAFIYNKFTGFVNKKGFGAHGDALAVCYINGVNTPYSQIGRGGIFFNDESANEQKYKAMDERWPKVHESARNNIKNPPFNVASSTMVHECAHSLDMLLGNISNDPRIISLMREERKAKGLGGTSAKMAYFKTGEYALTEPCEYFAERINEAITSKKPSKNALEVLTIAKDVYNRAISGQHS